MKSSIDYLLDAVEWTPCDRHEDATDESIPYATHTGQLKIGSAVLDCAMLSNGIRVFTEESILRAFGVGGGL